MDKKLLIEIDGGQHNIDNNTRKDLLRTKWLEGKGYLVLRFWNNDIVDNVDGVVDSILEVLKQKSPPSL